MTNKLSIITVFLTLTISLFGQKSLSDSIADLGLKNYEKNNFQSALSDFDKALTIDKQNEKAIIGKINTLIKLDKIKDADKYAETGLTSDPKSPVFNYAKGIVLFMKEQYKKSFFYLDETLNNKLTETTKNAYITRGLALNAIGEYDDAVKDFTKHMELSEETVNTLYYRGFTYYLSGNYLAAIADFEKVVSLDDKNGYAFYNLGMSYYKTEDKLSACKFFQIACKLKIENACKMIVTNCRLNN